MNVQKLLFKNLLSVGIYKYLGEAIFFLSSVVISRLLLPEEFGVIAIMAIFYNFLARFTDMGVSETFIREVSETDILKNIQILFLIIGLITSAIMVAISYPLSVFFDQEALLPLGLTYAFVLLLYAFPKAMIAHLRKEKQLTLIAKVELMAVVIQVLISIALAWIGFSYWSLVIPHIFAPFFYYFFYRRYVRIPFEFSFFKLRIAWHKARSMVYAYGSLNFIQYWEKTIDNLWIGKFYGEATLGLYNRAYMLMSMPANLVVGHVNNILLPLVANESLSERTIKQEMICFIKLISAMLAFPAVIFILFPVDLSVFLWGENWVQVGKYLGVLSIALLVLSFYQLSINLYVILRKERMLLINGTITGVTTILLISIGAFYSVETIIYLFLGGVLFINTPITLLLGYHRSFGFSWRQIIDVVGFNYAAALLFFTMKLFQVDGFLLYPAVLLMLVSVVRIVHYFRRLR